MDTNATTINQFSFKRAKSFVQVHSACIFLHLCLIVATEQQNEGKQKHSFVSTAVEKLTEQHSFGVQVVDEGQDLIRTLLTKGWNLDFFDG